MTEPRKLRVFLCHSSQDKPLVRELYQRLVAEGWIDPWLDEENLLPGQDWDLEIEKAVEATDAVIVCISSKSVTKEGYVQKEIRKVLDLALEKPEETIFIIPLRLDDGELPRRLRTWQYVDYFPADRRKRAYSRLLQSLRIRHDQLSPKEDQDEKIESVTIESFDRGNQEKTPPAISALNRVAETLPKTTSGRVDMGESALQIFFFAVVALFGFGYTDSDMMLLVGASAILTGLFLVVRRQMIANGLVKFSTLFFIATYILVIYSQFTGWEIATALAILNGIAAVIVIGLLAINLQSPRRPARYASIFFAVFLFLLGLKLIFNSFAYHPNFIQTPIFITGLAAVILLWLEL